MGFCTTSLTKEGENIHPRQKTGNGLPVLAEAVLKKRDVFSICPY